MALWCKCKVLLSTRFFADGYDDMIWWYGVGSLIMIPYRCVTFCVVLCRVFFVGVIVTNRAAKAKYELEQKEMARLQGFVDRFGAQAGLSFVFLSFQRPSTSNPGFRYCAVALRRYSA